MYVKLNFRHPHGACAVIALSHVSEVISLSFILSPTLCLPTYFVFGINETQICENHTLVSLYHVAPDEEFILYR